MTDEGAGNGGAAYDVLAAKIIAAHGVQGGVKVRLATKTARGLISPGEGVSRRPVDIWIGKGPKLGGAASAESDEGGRMATLTQLKETQPGGTVLLAKLQHLRERNSAEASVGLSIYVPESRRAPLQESEYFVDDLIGLDVVGDTGQAYGKIKAVLPQPGNDVYETDQGAMIPAVKEFVKQVDIAGGKVVVHDVRGLRPEEAEEVTPEPDQPD